MASDDGRSIVIKDKMRPTIYVIVIVNNAFSEARCWLTRSDGIARCDNLEISGVGLEGNFEILTVVLLLFRFWGICLGGKLLVDTMRNTGNWTISVYVNLE